MASYIVGNQSPALSPDAGSGPWCAAPQEMQYGLLQKTIRIAIETDDVRLKVGPDAVAQMRHYLDNTGSDYIVDIAQMMARSDYLKHCYSEELEEAKHFSETLKPGNYSITSSRLRGGYFRRSTDSRYFYAIGGFTYWGQGKLLVERVKPTQHRFTLDFEFHFYDRYNWDNGKTTEIGSIKLKDEYLQELHRRCYAREYDVKGELTKQVKWENPPSDKHPSIQRDPFAALK